MGKTPQSAFVMWLFFTIMLGVLWVLVQYGRSLWMRMKTLYIRMLWLEQEGLLSNAAEVWYKREDERSSQHEEDKAKS